MIKVIGFDLDNTLYDQTQFEFAVFKIISKKMEEKYAINQKEYFEKLKKLYLSDIKSFLFDKAFLLLNKSLPNGWEAFIEENILQIYRTYLPKKMNLYENIITKLEMLRSEKYKLVLITNGNEQVQLNKIKALDINSLFDVILISDSFTPIQRKPNTYMFQKTLDFFNINSDEMIFIGDDIIRDKSSEKIGIKFIHINDFNFKNIGSYCNEK